MSTPSSDVSSAGPAAPPDAGYAHPGYAAALAEFGAPRALPRCGGWVLERPIPGTPHRDAMGCYPLFACRDWSRLPEDLAALDTDLVSVSAVPDPFGAHDPALLKRSFGDRVVPFKEHYVTDLEAGGLDAASKHHRYYVRHALKAVQVELSPDPAPHLDAWTALYAQLAARHALKGILAFSRRSFAAQLALPGMRMFRALADGDCVGAHLWLVRGDVAYSHLAAFSARGYDLMASYALYGAALDHFRGKVRWLELGGEAGAGHGSPSGLGAFKKGWSTGTRTVYLCGRVGDRALYEDLVRAHGGDADGGYFPTYRRGEFD